MVDERTDFHRSTRGRRQSWYGAKAVVKRLLAARAPHVVMRRGVALLGNRIHYERLPAPAHLDQVTATMAGVSFVMLRPDRCIVAKELYWGGGQRPRAADQLALDLFAALAREADLVLDIGAYTGIFSLLAARVSPRAAVHAFEIVPDVADAARANVAANDLGTRITLHGVGVGRDGDSVRIAARSSGSALPDFYSTKLCFADGVDVPVRSLDAIVTHELGGAEISAPSTRAVVKIDVEGTEHVVLGHGQRFLAASRPDLICEVLPGVAEVGQLRAALEPHGYRYLTIEPAGLREHPRIVPRADARDWLLTTRSDGELARLPGWSSSSSI